MTMYTHSLSSTDPSWSKYVTHSLDTSPRWTELLGVLDIPWADRETLHPGLSPSPNNGHLQYSVLICIFDTLMVVTSLVLPAAAAAICGGKITLGTCINIVISIYLCTNYGPKRVRFKEDPPITFYG